MQPQHGGQAPLNAIEAELLTRMKKAQFDVEFGSLVGRGGFGRVYKGTWKGTIVAIKLIEHDGKLASDEERSLEAFLSKSMSHPNIVQTFCVHTTAPGDEGPALPSEDETPLIDDDYNEDVFSRMAQDKPQMSGGAESQHETMIVLEYCDQGSLHQAIKDKVFRGNGGRPKMHSILLSALDVANALSYLHSIGITHGDLKAANVLLKTANTDQRGFMCKVSDFGLARMTANEQQLKTFTYGTVSHMPPELLKDGLSTPAMDVYSYGMLLWEMLSEGLPYPNKNHGEILLGVVRGQRPKIPDNFPPGYAGLIEDCWQQDFSRRPDLTDVVKRLKTLFVECSDTQQNLARLQTSMMTRTLDAERLAAAQAAAAAKQKELNTAAALDGAAGEEQVMVTFQSNAFPGFPGALTHKDDKDIPDLWSTAGSLPDTEDFCQESQLTMTPVKTEMDTIMESDKHDEE
ncbi:hypothetical protein BSKO_00916 [Bryopsis sp. KO-2023]|nr:hypothetical protein BSKO_00916 [Bryopsis sp. KO-2023]